MLDYDLAQRGELSLYEYLYRRIRDDIVAGLIAPDDRLPSKRSLAQHLGVSLVTVESAYAQLVAEGYIHARPRSGYFASALPGLPPQVASVSPAPPAAKKSIAPASAHNEDVPLEAPADPSLARLWSRALRETLASEPEAEVFGPSPAQGLLRLRRAISAHLRQTRGMEVDPDRILVGAGAQILDNIAVQLLGHGLTYGVEDPGYPRLTRLYQANGVRLRHIPLDSEGVCMRELERQGVDVIHLMPSHQFPTGLVTSIARRYELLGWASADAQQPAVVGQAPDTNCSLAKTRWIIEDDYDCEFRLAGRPVPALASIDATQSVIYTNTFSKSLGAALRLAYMVLPPCLMERYNAELGFYSSTVSSVQQVALARLLESGAYERHVARMRKAKRESRDELIGLLRAMPWGAAAPDFSIEEEDSGLHFVLAARTDLSEKDLAKRIRSTVSLPEGTRLTPLSSFARLPQNRVRPDNLARLLVQY